MLRISDLRNTPVIINQKTVGILHSISIDMVQKKVHALHVSCGLLGRRLVMPEDILNITNEFILVGSIYRYKHPVNSSNARFIRDSTGMLIGYVTDYIINTEHEFQLEAVEMRVGFLPKEYAVRIWALDFFCQIQDDELIVPASLGCELTYSSGRNV